MKASSRFQIGDPVVVKAQVRDPDLGTGIGGWQGTISHVSDEENMVCVDWDSATLDAMPASVIDYCERQGLGWNQMYLAVDDVEHASRRDTPAQRGQTLARLEAAHQWSHLDPEGALIQEVLGAIDPRDTWAMFEAWAARLRQALRFPFEAVIAEPQDRGPLRTGERLTVRSITLVDDLHGLIVEVTHKRRRYDFPLCDLKVLDPCSPSYDLVQAYVVWFANR
jgi:hypothetical protein